MVITANPQPARPQSFRPVRSVTVVSEVSCGQPKEDVYVGPFRKAHEPQSCCISALVSEPEKVSKCTRDSGQEITFALCSQT